MGSIREGKVIGKDEDLFLSLYIPSLSVPHCQTLSRVKIVIATVELFIKCFRVFVALCLGTKTTTLVIACTTSPAVEFSPKWNLLTIISTIGGVVISTIFVVVV